MTGRKPEPFTYMLVTADNLELPLCPPFDTAKEMAEFLRVPVSTVYRNVKSYERGKTNTKQTKVRYIKFKEDEGE